MSKYLHASAAALGSRGSHAGVGESKRRGDSSFYRRLVAQRKDRTVMDTAMDHRHLNHRNFTLAAIDDIISNGQWDAWRALRLAMSKEAGIREKILKVCNAQVHDPSAQRHHFWRSYAQKTSTVA